MVSQARFSQADRPVVRCSDARIGVAAEDLDVTTMGSSKTWKFASMRTTL
jgi:hypothetical protein